jgi:hypothetical protein
MDCVQPLASTHPRRVQWLPNPSDFPEDQADRLPLAQALTQSLRRCSQSRLGFALLATVSRR